MNVGEEFEFYGIPLRAEREMSDLSCEGCFFKYIVASMTMLFLSV